MADWGSFAASLSIPHLISRCDNGARVAIVLCTSDTTVRESKQGSLGSLDDPI
jgi:hypothetical protein